MVRNVFIYSLIDPRTNEIRYVGKSVNPKRRLVGHIHHAKQEKPHSHKLHWIRQLLKENLKPIIQILEEVKEEEWKEKEIYYISYYRSLGKNLTNATDGGEGLDFVNLLQVSKRRIGFKHTEEAKKSISESTKKVAPEKWTPVLRAKCCISQQEASKTRKPAGAILWKQNGLKHWQFKEVLMYDYEGNIVKKFSKAEEITEHFGFRNGLDRFCRLNGYLPEDGFIYRYETPDLLKHWPNTRESVLEFVVKIGLKNEKAKENARINQIKGVEKRRINEKIKVDKYLENPKLCSQCTSIILYKNRNNHRFCSPSCASIFNNEIRRQVKKK